MFFSVFSSILIFSVLVFVHEFGHFLLAKLNGVGVIEFAIGFGRKLISFKYRDTTYSLRVIPLGGFVKMAGDDPRLLRGGAEAMEAATEELSEGSSAAYPRERWFLTQRYWPKFSIVIAGPAFNIIFAILAAFGGAWVYGIGEAVDAPIVGRAMPGFPAEIAGLHQKDRIVSIDGQPMTTWDDLVKTVGTSGGRQMKLMVRREGQPDFEVQIVGVSDHPEMKLLEGEQAAKEYKIGILPDFIRKPATFSEALEHGFRQVWGISALTLKGLGGMITGAISTKNISGPVFIFKEAANSANEGFDQVIGFLVFLSVSLAILNLLPIPVLDGGHICFFTIEAIKGSPINMKAYEWATNVGMLILFGLMALAFGNDIMRLVH